MIHHTQDPAGGAWAAMLAESYGEDPGVRLQFQGVADGQHILELQCRGMLRGFAAVDGVTLQGDLEGVALGYFTEDWEPLSQALATAQADLFSAVPPESLARIGQNAAALNEIAQPDWFRPLLGPGNVYVLQAIAVRRDRRGTGVFRRLLTPILAQAEARKVPVVLQTFDLDNLRKYEHMGFVLQKELSSQALGLTCYHMLHPGTHTSAAVI